MPTETRHPEPICDRPIVLAPMAGGPSTPRLCAEVSEAGGLGTLAGGYLDPGAFRTALAAVEELTDRPYAVNLFWPDAADRAGRPGGDAFRRYRELLADVSPHARDAGSAEPRGGDDGAGEKLALALDSAAAFVTFTFGMPGAATLDRCRDRGTRVMVTVTTPDGVRAADAAGFDAIIVQGLEAGGHRGTIAGVEDAAAQLPTAPLLARARELTDRPLIAAGGVSSAGDVAALLRAGAAAVQVGTRFLTAAEAGTRATHRRALLEFRDRDTVLTRAFSGKPARAIRTAFTDAIGDRAPALYPELHHLTSPMRARADEAGDPEHLNLWAGTGYRACRAQTCREILDELLPGDADGGRP